MGSGPKITEVADGWWCATCGSNAAGIRMEKFLKRRRLPTWKQLKELDGEFEGEDSPCKGIIVNPSGVYIFDFRNGIEPASDVAVVGAMEDFLLGVLAMGASAEKAVQMACDHHALARAPVQVVKCR